MKNTDSSKEPQINGTIVYGVKISILEIYGTEGLRKVLDHMEPAHKQQLESAINANYNYTCTFMKDYINSINKTLPAKGSQQTITDLVRNLAYSHLGMAMTIFLKIGKPHFIIQHFPDIWRLFFTHGTLFIENDTGKTLDVVLVGNEPYDEGICVGSIGWMQGAIEKSGAKNVVVTHPKCIFHGDEKCIFKFEWS